MLTIAIQYTYLTLLPLPCLYFSSPSPPRPHLPTSAPPPPLRKLSYEVFRLLFQVVLDALVTVSSKGDRSFLFFLLTIDVIALSDPLIKMTDIAMYERHLKRKYPRLTPAEFAAVAKEETCPVCLEASPLTVCSSCLCCLDRVFT